ncbi:MAG: YcxB family protein [Clostridia bacterium]|nr:YcxB family protein [Clostridia bacterium]
MEIHASSRYDRKSVAALCRMFRVKKTTPKLHIALMLLIYGFVAAVCVALALRNGVDGFLLALMAVCALGLCAELAIFFVLPRIQYRNLADLKDAENRFVFRETDFTATTAAKHQNAEAKLAYDALVRVVETRDYLFLFQTKNQTFIVDRATLSDADMQELRRRMAYCIGKRYSIYRY